MAQVNLEIFLRLYVFEAYSFEMKINTLYILLEKSYHIGNKYVKQRERDEGEAELNTSGLPLEF